MTSKELLYIEDALDHEKYFQTKCDEISGKISDGELKNTVSNLQQSHQKLFSGFMDLLS